MVARDRADEQRQQMLWTLYFRQLQGGVMQERAHWWPVRARSNWILALSPQSALQMHHRAKRLHFVLLLLNGIKSLMAYTPEHRLQRKVALTVASSKEHVNQ